MSAAVVSGVVALMLQAQPYLTPDQVKCKLVSSAQPVNGSGNLAYSVFQQGAGQIDAYNAVFNQNTSCANAGLDITADLAGTRHFGGPANLGADGRYYIMNMDGWAWGEPESADGYTWSKGYTWSQSLPWTAGAAFSSGLTESAAINSWVDNE
jgi:serine protease AprX